MTTNELFWLAGLLEGEGSFVHGPPSSPNSPRIALSMTDEDIVSRVATLFGVKYHKCSVTEQGKMRNWKPTFVCLLRGRKAASLMSSLQPLMGIRRQTKIAEILSKYTIYPVLRVKLLSEEVQNMINEYLVTDISRNQLASKWGISYSCCCEHLRNANIPKHQRKTISR